MSFKSESSFFVRGRALEYENFETTDFDEFLKEMKKSLKQIHGSVALASAYKGPFNAMCQIKNLSNASVFPTDGTEQFFRFEMIDKLFFPGKLHMYMHSKTGNAYQVVGQSKDANTQETLVHYARLSQKEPIWTRRFSDFHSTVTAPDGKQVPRFVKVTE